MLGDGKYELSGRTARYFQWYTSDLPVAPDPEANAGADWLCTLDPAQLHLQLPNNGSMLWVEHDGSQTL